MEQNRKIGYKKLLFVHHVIDFYLFIFVHFLLLLCFVYDFIINIAKFQGFRRQAAIATVLGEFDEGIWGVTVTSHVLVVPWRTIFGEVDVIAGFVRPEQLRGVSQLSSACVIGCWLQCRPRCGQTGCWTAASAASAAADTRLELVFWVCRVISSKRRHIYSFPTL